MCFKTAAAFSATIFVRLKGSLKPALMAHGSQTSRQRLHSVQESVTPYSSIAPWVGHISRHLLHFVHFFLSITGFSEWCTLYFPAFVTHPSPMFLMAPPKPAWMCPVTWERTIMESKSERPFATIEPGMLSSPNSPSIILISAPIVSFVNPFLRAASRCFSSEVLFASHPMPEVSITVGLPPSFLTR